MSRWNADKGMIERWEPRLDPDYPGWLWVDCGCCAGICWGGEEPVECNCNAGWVAVHIESGTRALYPGGPFIGGREVLS